MDAKICRTCNELKALVEYYKHSAMADKHLNICKSCTKARVRKHRFENDFVREYDRKRGELPHRVKLNSERCKADRRRWPEKYKARMAVSNAVRDGRLNKPKLCENCGAAKRLTGHHENYLNKLDVIWLCHLCHMRMEFAKPF